MDDSAKRRIVEAVILGTAEPISAQRVAGVVPYAKPGKIKKLVEELNAEYVEQGRAFEIVEVAGGYQMRTLPEFAPQLQQIQPQRPLRLSKAALETLAIVAYKQPGTRAEIEYVRGVESGAVLKSLLDRHLVKIVGQKEVPGRPMLYGTTKRFLEVFGLKSVKDLPTLREIEELAREQGMAEAEGEGGQLALEESPPESEAQPSEDEHPPEPGSEAEVPSEGTVAFDDAVPSQSATSSEGEDPSEEAVAFAEPEAASDLEEEVVPADADAGLDFEKEDPSRGSS
jgi:segregation and condensation protein B